MSNLQSGVDKLYLQAEALWRQSLLAAAADALLHARQLDYSSSLLVVKASSSTQCVLPLQALLACRRWLDALSSISNLRP